ncbi:MAG: hypothetical protein ACE37F_03925 [Nannocystaceae bacterium]|nr:hypothetical protein [bacterium]
MRSLLLVAALAVSACRPLTASGKAEAAANEACGTDQKAKSRSAECQACCEKHGVSESQFDGMNRSCICG